MGPTHPRHSRLGPKRHQRSAVAAWRGEHARYDPIDNLRSWTLGGVKDLATYVYGTDNRLAEVRNTAGNLVHQFNYDPQGNITNRNTVPHDFDYGNRLRAVPGIEAYRYDGSGRRVQSTKANGSTTLWMYSQGGQMLFSSKLPAGGGQTTHENVYLGGSLVATIDHNWPSNAIIATKYQHTDALGSPVAITNEAGAVIERTNFDPYGGAVGKVVDGIGYTGHVMDPLTGLTYMQQRYYDQGVGRFLSVDPIAANPNDGQGFNVYQYAANNPYRFMDPDGRREEDKEKRDRRSMCGTKLCDGRVAAGRTAARPELSGTGSTAPIASREQNGNNGAGGQNVEPKPPGDFVLMNGVWIHRSALNANVLDHPDNQNSHVSVSTGGGVAGFVLLYGESLSFSGAADTSGAACAVKQSCVLVGLGGLAGGGGQAQAGISRGPMTPGKSTTHGAFLMYGAGYLNGGGSIDVGKGSLGLTGGLRSWAIGAAVGYQYCNTEVSSCQ